MYKIVKRYTSFEQLLIAIKKKINMLVKKSRFIQEEEQIWLSFNEERFTTDLAGHNEDELNELAELVMSEF